MFHTAGKTFLDTDQSVCALGPGAKQVQQVHHDSAGDGKGNIAANIPGELQQCDTNDGNQQQTDVSSRRFRLAMTKV